ncbi:P-loop containing nucleoside triphosphate hydrolase protein [Xylariomycetidae sp. FL2044]|nr:P-loop containing nucleoside triphosphate hydrolase protein [Xylariomycetidae sp. FL2044]
MPQSTNDVASSSDPNTNVTLTTDDPASKPTMPAQRQPAFADYLRVFSYATRWDMYVYAVASVASIGAGVTLPLMNIIFGQLVGQFSQYFREGAGDMTRSDFERLLDRQALYIVALFLGRWVLNAVNKFCFRMIGIRLSSAVRRHYLESLFAQPIHVIDSMAPGAPATAITDTSNTLQLGISERLGTFLEFNGTIWAAVVVAFVWSWDLTLVTCSLLLYILAVLVVILPLVIKSHTAILKADAGAVAVASEALGSIRLVVASGAYDTVISRYDRWVKEAAKRGRKVAPLVGLQMGLIFFGIFGAFGLAFWYGTQRFMAGAIANSGVVIVVLMSVIMILTSVERIATPLMAVSKATVAACEFFTVIDAPRPDSGSLKPEIDSIDLVFHEVTFVYPSRPSAKALDNVSFQIKSGFNTAIVGSSGSGKSTIVALLERWYSLKDQHVFPQVAQAKSVEGIGSQKGPEGKEKEAGRVQLSGSIRAGGYNLEDLDLRWWRSQIGLVQQEPFLFNDTIFNNVSKGLIGTCWEEETESKKRELVEDACREAYAHEFVDRLPDRYDTRIGDGGAKLSGGQKQRIAIARSIIKKPRIIIFDEATSAIDAKGEKIVQAALDRVARGRTTITIAHRLSTIKKADHIIVLKNGRVVEQGTHQNLTAVSWGVYRGLVQAQALHLTGRDDSVAAKIVSEEVEEDPREILKHDQTWRYYLAIVLASMVVGAGTPIQAWLFAKVIGVFLLQDDELENQASFWGLMWLALAGGVGVGYFLEGWVGLRVQYFVSAVYKASYLTDILYQKVAFFDQDDNSHGALTSRIASDAKQLEELLGLNLAFLLHGTFTVVGCIIISLVFGWKLALVATFVTMPVMLASGYWKLRYEVQFDKMNSAVFMESSQFATEAIGAIRTVAALTMEPTINSRYKQLLDGQVREALRKARWTSLIFGFADSASLGCQALVSWYGGRLIASREYPLEAFFVCFIAIIQGAEAASQALAVAPNAAQASSAANRILDVEKSATINLQREKSGKDMVPGAGHGVQIEFRDVSFKYPTRDIPIFEGLNLTIEKGQYAALVGPSGCGKTTIISLLERFYDLGPDQGAILCNGINVNVLNSFKYRHNLSLVAQEPTLFQGTIRDNILFGVPEPGSATDEKIAQVCRDAFIHDFIMSLPEGYATDVGQKGVSMSGGQKQRIAIARALMRDPKLLLLDEATSALDSESEKSVQVAFERAREGRTMVVVAHQLSTIQNADVIFVFNEGRVVEKGTHESLLKLRGVYWGMCQSQALDQ